MASIKEIQLRIKSVQDTMKITNAMYLISSSKIKKAKKSLEQTVPYFKQMQTTIGAILMHSPEIEHPFFDKREKKKNKKTGFLVLTGDKGLCGSYNHNVIHFTEELLKEHENNKLYVIGIMGKKYFAKKKVEMEKDFQFTVQSPTRYRARDLSELVLNLYQSGELDEIYIVYTEMVTMMKMEPKKLKLLPLDKTSFENPEEEKYKQMTTFSPSAEIVLNYIVPNYLKGVIYGAMVESFASENNARMMAMDSSTENAKEMLSTLSLAYNRARQAAITQEITEVVSGAQVM